MIKIGSEMAEISINITISNTCVSPQILDDLKKQNSIFYVVFQPMPMLVFLLAFLCWLYYAQPAGPYIGIFN